MTRARIDRAIKKLKLDRCRACIGRPLSTAVIYEGNPPPEPVNCDQCGRSLLLIIEVVYVEEPPPAWFFADNPGIDTETTKQRWRDYLAEHEKHLVSASGHRPDSV